MIRKDAVWISIKMTVLFGYRTLVMKRRNIFFLKVHVQYKCKDLTQCACYGRDSCRDSEGRL